ncbi:hypothetical protein P3X46_028513 [Hevea brasiliensis]|uniref:Histone-lysine N-methyltransferase n=1 Tax=Hevea brasiliensis TaxID=3981 RepID=A0ABQ9KSM8_HEVBR|nr:hypothetical protein P3X46_028513 [Hevea brasiliensis]
MGSCENSLEVHEPLHQVAVEQHVCFIKNSDSERLPLLEAGLDMIDHNVGSTSALDRCLMLSQTDNAGCVSYGDFTEAASVDREIELVCDSGDMVGLVPGKLLEDECGVACGYFNGRQSGLGSCNVKIDGLCVEKVGSSDDNGGLVNSLEECESSLELMPISGSLRNCDQQDERKDDWSGIVQGDTETEEKNAGLAATEIDACNHMLSSSDCEMPVEIRSMNALPRNGVEQDKQDSFEGVIEVIENKSVGLSRIETDIHNQMWSSLDHGTLSELIPTTVALNNCNSPSAEEFTEVMKEKSSVSPVIDTTIHGQLSSCQDFDMSLESMPAIGSPEKIIQRDEEKDGEPVGVPFDEGATEGKNNLLVWLKSTINNQISSSLDDEMCMESDFAVYCQQNDMEANIISSKALERAVDVNNDTLALIESDVCTQKSQHSIEIPRELSNDQKNGMDANCLTAERVPTDNWKQSDIDLSIQACPSQGCQMTLENLVMADSLSNCDQKNLVYGPSVERMPYVVEEESDVTTEIKVEIHGVKLCVVADACDLKDGSPEISPNIPQSWQPFDVAENGSYEKLDVPNLLEKDIFGTIYSSNAADHSERTDNEGKDCAGNAGPSKNKCPDIGSSSSRRSNRKRKSCQKTQTKRAARKSKNKGKVRDSQIFKAERRKRSCFSKPARSSNWGLLGNITQFFEQSNGLEFNEIQNPELSKRKVGQGSGKLSRNWNSSRAGGSSQWSGGKKHALTSGIRLKVKVGKEFPQNSLNIVVPEVIDTSASAAAGGVREFDIKSCQGTSFEIPNFANCVEDKMGQEGTEDQLQCFGYKLEDAKIYSNASISDLHVEDNDLQGTLTSQKSVVDASSDYLGVPAHVEYEASKEVAEKSYTDAGTSPDSEVINLVPEGQVNSRCQEDFPDAVFTSSKVFVAPVVVKRGKKKDRLTHASDCFPEDISPAVAGINKVKATKKHGGRQRKGNEHFSNEIHISPTRGNASSNSSICKEFSEERLHFSRETEPRVSKEDLQSQVKVNAETKICSGLDVGRRLPESQNSNKLLPSTKSKGWQLPRKSGVSKGRSKDSDNARSKSANGFRHKGNKQQSVDKNKIKEKNGCDLVVCKAEDDLETRNCNADDFGKKNPGDNVASTGVANLDMASNDVMEQHLPVDNAWVRCDDCHKWRRIPVALVDSIGQTNCKWICKDNLDTAFADCSIPQEKSNAEINTELGISDADEDAYDIPSKNKGLEFKPKTVTKEHEFTRISTNQFLHRTRRTLTIDEIMVCYCKPPLDGGLGCGDECLNRMLNIECVQGTCPCGDLCSNQQFQKRNYAKMKWDRCGKKGFGLRLEEDISKGQFLIEYVGEVLDVHTYEARLREYASKSHKHFYFMTLDGSEVIDACAKGNLGRFINHSCDPNCRTEKWVVNGEICIGLFALRDIKKGEELTFHYKYVRVGGAAAKRCYCGSPHCQGYIGGDLRNTEVIDQVDSDEEFLEPVMLEDGEAGDALKNRIPRTSSLDGIELQVVDSISKDRDTAGNSTTATGNMEVVSEIEDSMNQSVSPISQLHSSLEIVDLKGNFPFASPPKGISVEADYVTSKSTSAVKHVISKEEIQRLDTSPTTMLSKSLSDGMVANRKSKSATAEEKRVFVKSRFLIKTSCESGFSKKGKFTSNHSNVNKVQMMTNKSQVLPIKPKKFMDGTSNGRFEAVEEKLNELLDADGGISKRKDAPKGYLKLLLLTAASGASGNGEAIQSNRDLSMILGALLKTKSRVVLVDIINKNGLRMLHNMLKQYQKDFKKTPILRKLLKVLEYLAVKEILTPEHINGGPPCPGMESFSGSILSLTEHNDKQVHQIARNFRDKWIPWHSRKYSYMDREDGKMEFYRGSISNRVSASQNYSRDLCVRPTEAIDCATQSKQATTSVDAAVHEGCSAPCVGGMKTRKRKSRWDQPADEKPSSRSLQRDEQKIQSGLIQQSEYKPLPDIGNELLDHMDKLSRENSYCPNCVRNYCQQDEASCADNERQDVPPGFSSPLNLTLVSSNASSTITDLPVGRPCRKFISRLSVSYGIPLPIVQQFGSPQDGTVESWAIAPGMPFHPFPPLPPFPHHKKETPSAVNSMVIDETTEGQQDRHYPAAYYPNENNPSTNGANQPDLDIPGENGQQTFKRAKGSSHDLGRRYFRQQKWNKGPPWNCKSDGWGYLENNLRDEVCSTDVRSVTNEHRNL